MKFDDKILALVILSIVFTIGCNQNSQHKIHEKSNPSGHLNAEKSTSISKIKESLNAPSFDSNKYISITDSLLTKIQGIPIKITTKIDTIREESKSIYGSLFTKADVLVKKYTFDPGEGSRELKFWIIEALYTDTTSAIRAFENLKKDALEMNDNSSWTPGLTYTNDFVIISGVYIFWLNTGCSYSYTNHLKLTDFMLRTLQLEQIQDSIWCKCGQSKCT
ncbi:MAG: hypothetical protein K1X49_13130 [Saprospiraceae bacterium]|nr:hypothetical protein [Saprospiraceae bacterium]